MLIFKRNYLCILTKHLEGCTQFRLSDLIRDRHHIITYPSQFACIPNNSLYANMFLSTISHFYPLSPICLRDTQNSITYRTTVHICHA